MPKYNKVGGIKGTRYMKDKKFCSAKDVPEEIKKVLEITDEYDTDNVLPETVEQADKTVRKCLFCNDASGMQRMLNQQTVYLCPTDYYDKNIGKIAAKLREVSNARNEEEAQKK